LLKTGLAGRDFVARVVHARRMPFPAEANATRTIVLPGGCALLEGERMVPRG
jgi:hypothetical protein